MIVLKVLLLVIGTVIAAYGGAQLGWLSTFTKNCTVTIGSVTGSKPVKHFGKVNTVPVVTFRAGKRKVSAPAFSFLKLSQQKPIGLGDRVNLAYVPQEGKPADQWNVALLQGAAGFGRPRFFRIHLVILCIGLVIDVVSVWLIYMGL